MTTPGISDFFTLDHLEGVGISDFLVGIVLEFQDFFFFYLFYLFTYLFIFYFYFYFLSTALGIPDIFVKSVLEFHPF